MIGSGNKSMKRLSQNKRKDANCINGYQGTPFRSLQTVIFFEIDRKDNINAGIHLPITITGLLIGGLVYFLNNLPSAPFNLWSICFYIFLSLTLVVTAVSTYFVYRTLHGHTYEYVSSTLEIDKYISELIKYNEEVDKKKPH